MFVSSLKIKTFRCFEALTLEFNEPITVLEGPNGAGKTSVIEALYYACYLRSFKTHLPRELVRWESDHFFLALEGRSETQEPWELKIAATALKRQVKADGVALSSYKELFERYRIIVLGAHDMELVQGSPEERRQFVDHAILLTDPLYLQKMRSLKKILRQRNAFLSHVSHGHFDTDAYEVWTDQLQKATLLIREERKAYLKILEAELQALVHQHLPSKAPNIELLYQEGDEKNCSPEREISARRSLQGAHLDEIQIMWNGQSARRFASRGQHKLLIYFLKLAQLTVLKKPAIVLIDDFVTDFDDERTELLVQLLCKEGRQVIFTTPSGSSLFRQLKEKNFSAECKLIG